MTVAVSKPEGPGTTYATGTSPSVSCGTPATAASATPSTVRRTASISSGWMFSPPRMTSSLIRPQMVK